MSIAINSTNSLGNNVTLDAGPLPPGINASFSPDTFTPPGTSTLVLTAAASADLGLFAVQVFAASADETNSAMFSLSVDQPGGKDLGIQIMGAPVIDPQTGLYEQVVVCTNLTSNPLAAIRLFVSGLPLDVALYNASATTNGIPFVEYDQTVGPNSSVQFMLEYYRSNRLDFISSNFIASVAAPQTPFAVPTRSNTAPTCKPGAQPCHPLSPREPEFNGPITAHPKPPARQVRRGSVFTASFNRPELLSIGAPHDLSHPFDCSRCDGVGRLPGLRHPGLPSAAG
jgi:hypothetical protein